MKISYMTSCLLFFCILHITLFLTSSQIYAAPQLTSVSGTWSHKNTVAISGSDFGTKSPASPRVWDWCDNTNTNNLNTFYSKDPECSSSFFCGPPVGGGTIPNPGESDCEVGYKSVPWKGFAAPNPQITKLIGTCHTTSNGTWSGSINADMFFTIPNWDSNTLFLMYWYRANPNYSNENNPDAGENWKEVTPNGSESGHSGCYLDGIDGVTWGWCGGGCPNETNGDVYAMGGSGPSCATSGRVFNHNPRFQWTHFEHLWNLSGHEFYSTIGSGSVKGGWANVPINMAGSTNPNNAPKSISIGGYNRFPRTSPINNQRMWAGIYADDTFSRVMLGNNSNWDNCTKREPQIPSIWNSNNITATVNLGSFTSGTAYLFVFDANNNHNSSGYPITISGGGGSTTTTILDSTPPEPPTGLTIIEN